MKRALVLVAAVEALAILALGILIVAGSMDDHVLGPSPAIEASGTSAPAPAGATADRPTGPPVPDGGTPLPADPSLPAASSPAFLLYGKITDEDGRALERADLRIEDHGERFVDARAEQGAYATAALGLGTWSVRANAPKHRESGAEVELTKEAPRLRLDLVLRRAVVLQVRFRTPGGEPLASALEAFGSDDSRPPFPTAVATAAPPDGDFPLTSGAALAIGGRYRARGTGRHDEPPREAGVDGTIELASDPPVWVSAVLRHLVLATEPVPPGSTLVTLTVDPARLIRQLASVRLRLVDADTGGPLTRARVAINDRQMGGGDRAPGPDGNLLFEKVRPGLLALEIEAPGREWHQRIVRLEPGRMNDLGTIALGAGVSVVGAVVDEDGRPVAGPVSAYPLDLMNISQAFDPGLHTSSKPDGTFGFEGVPRGRLLVRTSAGIRSRAAVMVDTSPGPVSGIVLRTTPGTPVTLSVPTTIAASRIVQVKDVAGTPYESDEAGSRRDLKWRLAAGDYRVEIWEGGTLRRTVPLAVAGEPVKLQIAP